MEFDFCKNCPMKGPQYDEDCQRELLLNEENLINIPFGCPHIDDLIRIFYLLELLKDSRNCNMKMKNKLQQITDKMNQTMKATQGGKNKNDEQKDEIIKKLSTRLHDCRKENKELKEHISAQGGSIDDVNKYFKNKWR